ncbi:hypothetical protein [Lysobacter gummosus]|uniref:hypothetical protein n=1 Tax=Lysobacter gummosus TaxID=262324 RepID=UPI00362F3492
MLGGFPPPTLPLFPLWKRGKGDSLSDQIAAPPSEKQIPRASQDVQTSCQCRAQPLFQRGHIAAACSGDFHPRRCRCSPFEKGGRGFALRSDRRAAERIANPPREPECSDIVPTQRAAPFSKWALDFCSGLRACAHEHRTTRPPYPAVKKFWNNSPTAPGRSICR